MRKKKDLVGDRQFIDIRAWYRNKLLGPTQDNDVEFTWVLENGDQRVVSMSVEVRRQLPLILRYEIRGDSDKSEQREPVQLRVGMGFSPCHYGGRSRPWFICPREECSRRVAILYLEGRAFLCRRCASLTYPCRRLDRRNRALLQTRKLRTRLGGSAHVTDPFPEKPDGMRWKTYNRHKAKADELQLKWDPLGLLEKLKKDVPGHDPSVYEFLLDPKKQAWIMEMRESSMRE
jgi:hypothetical protein